VEAKRPIGSVLQVPLRISNDALTNGNKLHTAATIETTGYAQAFRHAFDWQQTDRLR
jgi:hypothetical protein